MFKRLEINENVVIKPDSNGKYILVHTSTRGLHIITEEAMRLLEIATHKSYKEIVNMLKTSYSEEKLKTFLPKLKNFYEGLIERKIVRCVNE